MLSAASAIISKQRRRKKACGEVVWVKSGQKAIYQARLVQPHEQWLASNGHQDSKDSAIERAKEVEIQWVDSRYYATVPYDFINYRATDRYDHHCRDRKTSASFLRRTSSTKTPVPMTTTPALTSTPVLTTTNLDDALEEKRQSFSDTSGVSDTSCSDSNDDSSSIISKMDKNNNNNENDNEAVAMAEFETPPAENEQGKAACVTHSPGHAANNNDSSDDEPLASLKQKSVMKKSAPTGTPRKLHFDPLDEDSDDDERVGEDNAGASLISYKNQEREHPNNDLDDSGYNKTSTDRVVRKTTTKSRKKTPKKKAPGARLKPGARVRIKKLRLYHSLVNDEQVQTLKTQYKDFPSNAWLYGTVMPGASKKRGWSINFEFVGPVLMKSRKAFVIIDENAEEPRLPQKVLNQLVFEEQDLAQTVKDVLEMESEKEFLELDEDAIKSARRVSIKVRGKMAEVEEIDWEILPDGEDIKDDDHFKELQEALDFGPRLREGLDLRSGSHAELFFKRFFPSVVGIGARMDKFYSDHGANGYLTVKARNIKFHDPDAQDPDCKIKQCILLMIAGANEPYNGMSLLWKRGKGIGRSEGQIPYPNFGRYVQLHEFQCFKTAIARMWSDEKYWYLEYGYEPWEMFEPFIEKWNDAQLHLFDDDVIQVCETFEQSLCLIYLANTVSIFLY